MRYLELAWVYLRLSALNEMQYRANLVMQSFSSLLQLGIGVAGLGLVFLHTDSLAGWAWTDLLIVMGVYLFIGGVVKTLIEPSMSRFMDGVQDGMLDYTLTKPEDAQLLVSMTEIQVWRLTDVVLGLGVIGYALVHLGDRVGPGEAVIFLLTLFCGGLIVYGFWLMLATTAFWFVRTWSLIELVNSLYQAGRWPVGIYPTWLRLGLTFFVPIAFAVTVPAQALTQRLTFQGLAVAVLVTLVILAASRWVWKFGLRHYSGASA